MSDDHLIIHKSLSYYTHREEERLGNSEAEDQVKESSGLSSPAGMASFGLGPVGEGTTTSKFFSIFTDFTHSGIRRPFSIAYLRHHHQVREKEERRV